MTRVLSLAVLLAACGTSGSGPSDAATGDAAADAAADASSPSDATSDATDASSADASDAGVSYATTFSLTENPISEGGHWRNGKTDGVDWADVRTENGIAHGTVVSTGPAYDDSTAVLAGTWPDAQSACATVHSLNQTSSVFEEVELRLRTTIVASSITGYEFNFRATADGSQYVQIVRWNGALNSFDYVNSATGPGIHDGDQVCATASGSTLTAFVNGTQIVQGTDATFPSGSPGVGFYMQGGSTGQLGDYGFTSFTASTP